MHTNKRADKRFAVVAIIALGILATLVSVYGAEVETESNLTDRQLLLLQVPETHTLRLTIADQSKTPPEVRGYALWSVLQSDSVGGGPIELFQFIFENRIEYYITIGEQMQEVIWKGYEGEEDYILAGTFKNNRLKITFTATGEELTEEEITALSADMARWVKAILKRLGILDDAELAKYIKSQKFGAKKATHL